MSHRTAYAMLLDAGIYLASASTFYRLLRSCSGTRGRRDELKHPAYVRPELLATSPREVWSWDITKLKGPVKSAHFHLYVILDIFSRYVVGWMIADCEFDALAESLIGTTCDREGIVPGTLTLHADRGAAMRSKLVADLLVDMGVVKSHNRPYTSDDNPYSEAQCVFRGKLDTQSTANWTLVPPQTGHPFQRKLDSLKRPEKADGEGITVAISRILSGGCLTKVIHAQNSCGPAAALRTRPLQAGNPPHHQRLAHHRFRLPGPRQAGRSGIAAAAGMRRRRPGETIVSAGRTVVSAASGAGVGDNT